MRIASSQYHATMNVALQTAQAHVEEVIQQMSSGKRLVNPSDDPVTAVRVSRLTREEAALAQYNENIDALSTRLRQNESLLGGMVSDMQDARDLLVWAADGGNPSEDVQAMASSLVSLRDSLFFTANTRDQEGRHMFSGTATATSSITHAPLAAAGSRYTFTGNNGEQKVVVGHGVTQTANVTLEEVAPLLNRLDQAIEALQSPTVNTNDPTTRALVKTTLDDLDSGLSSVSSKIARLGGAQNTLQTLGSNHSNVSLSNKQALITLSELDYGEAAVQLNGYSSALQATQKAYSKVSNLSLFDVL